MTAFTPSPHQARLFDFIEMGRGSANVIAVAGSGKSTSIARALARIPEGRHVLVCMFNAAVCRDFIEKLDEVRRAHRREFRCVDVKTFHALGYGAVLKHLRGRGINDPMLDGKKLSKLMREKFAPEVDALYGAFAMKLASLARGEGIGAIAHDSEDAWQRIVEHHDVELDSEDADEAIGIATARELLRHSNAAAAGGLIDFDDQLYLPLLWRLRLWQRDFVFIDEAQDTNPVRRALAKLALRPGGRLIAVGDPRQAIYGFTGATAEAMNLIRREFSAIELPLTVSYRCARKIAEHARELVPYFEPHEGAAEGAVEELEIAAALKLLTARDAVLCRNVKPLIDFAYELIARGIGCRVLGREIGAGLISLVKKMRARGLAALIEKLEAFREREVAKHVAKGEEGKAEGISDRVDCVLAIAARLDERSRTVPALIAAIEVMFSDDDAGGVLTLSTMHKAKGREWDRVAILQPDLCPSKWARQDWQQAQEENLMYVARTRARSHLIYLTADRPQKENGRAL